MYEYSYLGLNAAEKFMETLKNLIEKLWEVFMANKEKFSEKPSLSTQEERKFQQTAKCWICNGSFLKKSPKNKEKKEILKLIKPELNELQMEETKIPTLKTMEEKLHELITEGTIQQRSMKVAYFKIEKILKENNCIIFNEDEEECKAPILKRFIGCGVKVRDHNRKLNKVFLDTDPVCSQQSYLLLIFFCRFQQHI